MKKVPTIFVRDPENMSRVLDEPHPDCGWVFAGEGVATRKYDGTCCMISEGDLYKRREIKPGKPIPDDFIQADQDPKTGKTVGWLPVGVDKEDQYHREAFHPDMPDGTYELVGPKIQGNPERFTYHTLINHQSGVVAYGCAPRTFEELSYWLDGNDIEGLVWHHPDGRMAKIKKRDFGLPRLPVPRTS